MEIAQHKKASSPALLGVKGWQIGVLLLILAASFLLNYLNNDFPTYYHVDEPSKARAILGGELNFYHPILMLQLNRAARFFLGYTDSRSAIEVGRTISALFGVVIVFATFLFSSRIAGFGAALLICAAAAFAPSIVVHSHYFKEDAIFTAFMTLSVFSFLLFMEKRSRFRTLFLGLATGLAFSSKYPGFLLIAMYLLAPLACSLENKRRFYLRLGIALSVAFLVFLLVNYPMFFEMADFKAGVSFEFKHALRGHVLKIYPVPHFFAFHFLNSIVPGTSVFVSILAVLYIPWMAFHWRATDAKEKFLMMYLIFIYFVIESTPQKAFPGFARYALPCIPPVIFFSYRSLVVFAGAVAKSPKTVLIATALFVVCLAHLAYQSASYTYYMNRDTRRELEDWLKQNPGPIIAEAYTIKGKKVKTLYRVAYKGIGRDTRYLVASSFSYARYVAGSDLDGQAEFVYRIGEFYKKLLKHTTKEIRPAYKTFANTNPTIKIIEVTDALRKDLKRSHARRKK